MGITKKTWRNTRGNQLRWVVELDTPAWKKPRLHLTLPKGSTKTQAYGFEDMFRAVYAAGHFDLFTALVDGDYPLQVAIEVFDEHQKDANVLRTEYFNYRRRTAADRIDSDEVIQEWLADIGESADPKTKSKYRGNVEGFFAWIRDTEDVETVNPKYFAGGYLRRYQTHLLGEYAGYAGLKKNKKRPDEYWARAATANRQFIGLSSLGEYLLRAGLIEKNWARGRSVKKLKERKNKNRAMPRGVWEAFHEAALEVDRENAEHFEHNPFPGVLLWDYLVATGTLVRQECLENLTPRKIQRRSTKDRGMVPVAVDGTKTEHRDRKVYIPRSLADRIEAHCERYGIGPDDYVFACPPHGARAGERKPFSDHLILKVWNRTMEKLTAQEEFEECGHYRPGNLRHTFGRFAIEGNREAGISGVDIMTLMRLMGHSNISTTQRYLEYSSDSADAFGAWVVGHTAGMDVDGSAGSPEKDAAARIIEAARKAGLDPETYFQALRAELE